MVNDVKPTVKPTSPSLKRNIGLFQLIMYGIGNIVGAGIYVLVGDAASMAGGMIWFSFLVGAIIASFTGLTYAELSSMYPRAASEYVYIGKAYGNRLLSFSIEWTMIITEIIAMTAVSLGFAGYMSGLTGLPVLPVAASLLVLLTIINGIGTKSSFLLNTILSIVAICGLVLVIAVGTAKLPSIQYFSAPSGISGILGASILIFFAYIGFDNIANISEDTKRPERALPLGLIISVLVTTILYILVGVCVVGLVPLSQLGLSNAPLALAVSMVIGPSAYFIISIIALLTTLNTVLVLMIATTREIFGMSREGALPKFLGTIDRRTGSPFIAAVVVLFASLIALSLGNLKNIAEITSFGALIIFALVNISLLHLRKVAPNAPRPFKAPLNVGWFSIPAFLGLLSCLIMLTQFTPIIASIGILLPISGAIAYMFMTIRNPLVKDESIHERHER